MRSVFLIYSSQLYSAYKCTNIENIIFELTLYTHFVQHHYTNPGYGRIAQYDFYVLCSTSI